jgi:hypothetical protein
VRGGGEGGDAACLSFSSNWRQCIFKPARSLLAAMNSAIKDKLLIPRARARAPLKRAREAVLSHSSSLSNRTEWSDR